MERTRLKRLRIIKSANSSKKDLVKKKTKIEKIEKMKNLKNIFYSILYFSYKIYKTHNTLNSVLLIYLEKIGIKDININPHEFTIVFNDNTKLYYWNSNRWYAWMSEGNINFSNGEILKCYRNKSIAYNLQNNFCIKRKCVFCAKIF